MVRWSLEAGSGQECATFPSLFIYFFKHVQNEISNLPSSLANKRKKHTKTSLFFLVTGHISLQMNYGWSSKPQSNLVILMFLDLLYPSSQGTASSAGHSKSKKRNIICMPLQYTSVKEPSTLAVFLFFENSSSHIAFFPSTCFSNCMCHFIFPMGSQQKVQQCEQFVFSTLSISAFRMFKVGCFSVAMLGTHLASSWET